MNVQWQFWQHSGSGSVPEPVAKALKEVYRLEKPALVGLGYRQKRGHYAGRTVKFIRVFDATQVNQGGRTVRNYDDLNAHTQALLFEGHMEKDQVFLKDKRQRSTR